MVHKRKENEILEINTFDLLERKMNYVKMDHLQKQVCSK